MVVVEKLASVEEELKKVKRNHCRLTVSLELKQKKMERVRGELKKNDVQIESFTESGHSEETWRRETSAGAGRS